MKYFILTLDKSCHFVPQINDPAITRKLLPLIKDKEAYLTLPDHLTIPVATTEQTIWADVLISPVFMISKDIINVISFYGDLSYRTDVILLDQKNIKSKTYCISSFTQAKGKQLSVTEQKKPVVLIESHDKINKWNNIFQVIINAKIYTIINLDLAESLLRRNLAGIGLEEVIIRGL